MDKFTLTDFLKRFSTNEKCLEEIKNIRFPNGIKCPECGKITKFYKVTGRTAYACEFGGHQVFPLVGTIFEKTTTPLTSWFYAMFLMINTRAGISAKQLQRELGVTYKTAWRIGKQIRILMADNIKFEDGVVEIDEAFVGGKPRMKECWDTKTKEVVMGIVQRDGKVYLKHIENTGKWALPEQIQAHISPKVRVITDQYAGYANLKKYDYKHQNVNHNVTYVTKKDVYTQNIENVWSHLKRGIYGVYRHVSKKFLQAYADEFAFRYNNRSSSGQMFFNLLRQVSLVKMVSL